MPEEEGLYVPTKVSAKSLCCTDTVSHCVCVCVCCVYVCTMYVCVHVCVCV